jgi:hypothetical protein
MTQPTPGDVDKPKWEYCIVDTVISAYRDAATRLASGWRTSTPSEMRAGSWCPTRSSTARGRNGMRWPVLLLKRQKP